MKRVLSLLFALVFVVAAFPVTVASAADVIEISDAAQLAAIGTNDNYPLSGSYKLTKSISLSGYDNWTPIGNGSAFSGTFEGNGKTISGLKVNTSGTYAGLFGQVSGTVKNLTVTGSVTLNNTSSSATSVYAGILAGNVSGWLATIDSCSTSGDVTVTSNCTASFAFTSANVYAGGVIGNSSSFIGSEILSHKSGTVTASYTGSKATGNVYAGGIAGKTSGSLTDCYNKGDVKASTSKGSSYAGGLAGSCAATETSYNTGAITAGTYCGAIAGYATGSSTNCYYETGSASQAFGGSGMGSTPTATSKKASEMTNKKLSGFNFDDVWESSLISAPNHYTVNEVITGSVSVLGNFQVGEKLTADMSKVTPEKAYNGVIKYVKYQWESGTKDSEGNITFTKISGATGNTYTIASGDMGKYIRLVVRGRFTYGGKLESKEGLVSAAVPKNVKVATDDNGIKVTWDKISGASQYTIYRSTYSEGFMGFGAGFGSYSQVGTATTNSFLDTTVTTNSKYKYKVSVTMNGTESDQSAESAEITAQLACQHQWDSGKETTKATCEATGVKTYTCSVCKGTRTEVIPAKGHNYKTVTETKATCEKDGSKTVYCSNCYTTKTETTKAIGHSYDDGVITTQPNCETAGVKTYTCATCNGTKTENINPTGHSFNAGTIKVPPTCTKEGVKTATCSRCNVTKDITIEKTAHKFDGGTVTKQPTCVDAGSKTYKCTVCGTTGTEEVKALGHDYSKEFTIDKPATPTETGSKSKHCTRCDAKTDVTVIPKTALKAPVIKTAIKEKGVVITWGAVDGAASYNVYRKVYNTSTKKWDKKWKAVKTGVTATEYVDGSVTLGTQYKYLVKAVNDGATKNSESSDTVTFKISPTPKAYIKSNGIKIKWSPVVSAESYKIYRAEYNESKKKYNSYKKVKTVNGSTKEWTDTKVTSGKKYKYCIKAVKGSVVCSKAQSNSMYFLTKTTVKAAKAKTGVKVSWSAVKGATSFKIYRSELQNGAWTKFSQIGTAKSNVKSFTDTKVVSGVQYKYKVKAIKSKTGQTSSETAAFLYLAAPEVTVAVANDGINVSWSESAGATNYIVYRSTYDAKKKKWSSFKKQTAVSATTTSYKDTKAKSGTKYKYCVKAKNGSAVSAYLTSKSVKR